MSDEKISLIAGRIARAKKCIVFTGAGISTESGIPDYRSQGGIWDKVKPVYFDEFMSSRSARIRYWEQKLDFNRGLSTARPNKGHLAIARLHDQGLLHALITQNIDGLHQASGIPDGHIIELHGNTLRVRCMSCSHIISFDQAEKMILQGNPAPECSCGGFYKPDTISFGQAMPEAETRKAADLSSSCDLFVVVGSTLKVHPAASMPVLARNNGAFLCIINLSTTPMDRACDLLIRDQAGDVLEQIAREATDLKP